MSEFLAAESFPDEWAQTYADGPHFSNRFDDSLEYTPVIDGQEVERQWNQAILNGDFELANQLEELRTQRH